MPVLPILYDGWSLAHDPNSPAALHLLTLLALRPPEVEAWVALPEQPGFPLADGISTHVEPVAATEPGRLMWEQRILPELARKLGARLLHLTSSSPPLFGSVPCMVSPTGYEQISEWGWSRSRSAGVAGRLRDSLSQGGMARIRGVFWPSDLPSPVVPAPIIALPPAIHPAFIENNPYTEVRNGAHGNGSPAQPGRYDLLDVELPETYILYHGPHSSFALQRLLDAWGWAAGPVGGSDPLVVPGLDEERRQVLADLSARYGLGETVLPLPAFSIEALALLYKGCTALFHPAPISPWGGAVRPALAFGKPVVALENPLSDALVGPAAYLVPEGDSDQATSRALGAALITVVVEESVSAALSEAARSRSAAWRNPAFSQALWVAYQSVI